MNKVLLHHEMKMLMKLVLVKLNIIKTLILLLMH